MPSPEQNLHKIAVFTANAWHSALPLLRAVRPAEQAGLEVLHGNEWERVDLEAVSKADLVVIQRDFPRYLEACGQVIELARRQGKAVVYDLDDLLLDLPPKHPDRVTGYYDDALLPMLAILAGADAVTASTPLLCQDLRLLAANVHLLPNFLDDQLWRLNPPRPPVAEADRPLVVGYMGGDSHTPDLETIAPALLNTLERYPGRVSLHFWGAPPPAVLVNRPDVAWTHLQLYNYPEFAAYLLRQECDLWIAPLADNHFNRCKSAVKFLEYSAHGAPGVYSRLEPYESLVIPGENGLLAAAHEEWEQALADLIEKPDLRYELSIRAQMTVEQGWLLSQHAHRWGEAYSQAIPRGAGAVPAPARILWQAARRADAEQEARKALEAQLPARTAPKELVDRLQQSEQARQASEARLQEIYSSTAWKLVQALWRVRLALAPKSSARERLGRSMKEALRGNLRGNPAATAQSPAPELEFSGDAAATARLAGGPQPGDYDVIVLPIMDWASRRQRPQQLALQFAAAGHRLFYMHTSFRENRPPLINALGDNLFEVILPSPHPVNLYVDAMSAELEEKLLEAFKALQRHFGLSAAVILVDLPFWTPLALRLRDELGWKVVYDCMDYHAGFASNTPAMLGQEDRLVQESDLVLVTAQSLLERLRSQARLCLRLPNAADFQHFHNPPAAPAKEVENLGNPVIGYYGAIADWFDTALVGGLARQRPDWRFVLIGSTLYADLAPLQGLENVHLLGEMSYDRLPQFLHTFDVAIIPFKPTPLTHATNPVKLFEYLSAGKPVVATELDELRHYQEYVCLAASPEEWLAALEAALAEDSPELAAGRVEFARQNTWDARFALLSQAITQLKVSSER